MISPPKPPPRARRLAPLTNLSLVQHNSLGSWDVFLSLFHSFSEGPPVDFVLLQDPPVSEGFLPSFSGFKSFAPPVPRPRVAVYASLKLLSTFTVLPVYSFDAEDFLALDVYTPNGCFGTSAPRFRVASVYSRFLGSDGHSVPPHVALQPFDFPYLVAGDFNIHNSASDPFRMTSSTEDLVSAPYYQRASDLGFHLLNTPGVYPRFPMTASHRPSVINLAFANPHMLPFFQSLDASSLPSTGSDHVPIRLTLQPPSYSPPPRPRWDDTDWPSLRAPLRNFRTPPLRTILPHTSSTHGSPPPCARWLRCSKVLRPSPVPPPGPSHGGHNPLQTYARNTPRPTEPPESTGQLRNTPPPDFPGRAISRPSSERRRATGPISLPRPPPTTYGRPNSWSPLERPPASPPSQARRTQCPSTTPYSITSSPLDPPSHHPAGSSGTPTWYLSAWRKSPRPSPNPLPLRPQGLTKYRTQSGRKST